MNKMSRKLIIGVVVLIALAGAWYAVQQTTQEKKSSSAVPSALWQSFSWSDIQEMTVKDVRFQKIDNAWKVEKDEEFFPIVAGAINQIEAYFLDAQLKGKVSQNSSKHEELQVSESSGIAVTASTSNKKVVDIIIGGGFDSLSSYVRQSDEDTVYLVSPNGRHPFNKIEWRDLTLMPPVNNLQIEKISIEQSGTFRELIKQGETIEWKEGETDLDPEKVKTLMSALTDTQAADILLPSDDTKDAFNTPKATIQLDIKDQNSTTLVVGTEASGSEYYLQNPDRSDYIFTVSKSRIDDQWLRSLENLKKE